MTTTMRNGLRVFAGLLVAIAILTNAVEATPAGCPDACSDEEQSACFDCPLCSPGRAPSLLGTPDVASFDGPVSDHELLPTVRPTRTEERDIFHVPRLLL
jgi:hypothetical protein